MQALWSSCVRFTCDVGLVFSFARVHVASFVGINIRRHNEKQLLSSLCLFAVCCHDHAQESYLSVCLFVCAFVCLFVWLFGCLFVCCLIMFIHL